MKPILTIIFLIAAQFGEAQDTIKLYEIISGKITVENSQFKPTGGTVRTKLTDTIKVTLLVTAHDRTQIGGIHDKAYSMPAYSVRKWIDAHWEGSIYYAEAEWVHSHYLDHNKKPLPDNIIVWLSK